MSKLTEKFSSAYAKVKTMTDEEKNINKLMQKIILKKSLKPLIFILILTIAGISLKLNIWLLLGFEILSSILLFKHIKREGAKLNNFQYYTGNLLSVEDKGSHSVILIKQGKMPIKLKITYGKDSFSNIKKNQIIKIGYNKEVELATIIK